MRKLWILGMAALVVVVGFTVLSVPARTDTARAPGPGWEYASISEAGRGLRLHRPGPDYVAVDSWRELHAELAGKSADVSKTDAAEVAEYRSRTMNLLGAQGWELVTIQTRAYHQGSPSYFVYYFKRPAG